MGAFGIFAAILTFAYVVYYAVMISMDLFGNSVQKKENVEVIAAQGDNQEDSTVEDEAPTFIAEDSASSNADDNTNQNGDAESEQSSGDSELSPKDIESADDNELCKQAKEAKEQIQKAKISSNADYTEAEMEQNLDQLMREQEAKTEGLS